MHSKVLMENIEGGVTRHLSQMFNNTTYKIFIRIKSEFK